MRRTCVAVLTVCLLASCRRGAISEADRLLQTVPADLRARMPAQLGFYHWGGKHTRSMKQGVDQIAALGSKSARVILSPTYYRDYNIGQACFEGFTLTKAAALEDVDQSFSNPAIATFVVTTYDGASYSGCQAQLYLKPSFYTPANTQAVTEEYAAITLHLHRRYQGSGKTFILSNWEGDNSIYCGSALAYVVDPKFRQRCQENYAADYGGNRGPADSIEGMRQWMRARHAGVLLGSQRAREQGLSGVQVRSAVEFVAVRMVKSAGLPGVLHDVATAVPFDYLSFSAYESLNVPKPGEMLTADLDAIARVTGSRAVIIGEMGYSRTVWGAKALGLTHAAVVAAARWGVPLMIWWNLYDQSAEHTFGLFGIDGKPTPLHPYLSGVLR